MVQLMPQLYTWCLHLSRQTYDHKQRPLHDAGESAVNHDPHVSA